MSKRTPHDPFKSPPPASGFPPGTSGNRPNIQPIGSYEDASLGPNNGRALIKNMGSTGSARVQTGGIYNLVEPVVLQQGVIQPAPNDTYTFLGTIAQIGVPVPFACNNAHSLLITEIVTNDRSASQYFTFKFYLNNNPISGLLRLGAQAVQYLQGGIGTLAGVAGPVTFNSNPLVSQNGPFQFQPCGNILFNIDFDRVDITYWQGLGLTATIRGLYATGNASLFPMGFVAPSV
jgi:hypothetical protein